MSSPSPPPPSSSFIGRVIVLALTLSFPGGGCLPESGPGIGERVTASRDLVALFSGPAEAPSLRRPVFFTRPNRSRAPDGAGSYFRPLPADLYLLRAGQRAPERV